MFYFSKKTRKYFDDKRLTSGEKKILECWYLIKDHKYKEAITIMSKLTPQVDDMVEGQKHLLWGIALNNSSHYQESIEHIKMALKLISQYEYQFHIFRCHYTLFISYLNLKDANKMLFEIKRMQDFTLATDYEKICLLQCALNFHSFQGHIEDAQRTMLELNLFWDKMNEAQKAEHLVTQFVFYIRQDNLKQCHVIHQKMKSIRNFTNGVNYEFIQLLLNHLTHDKPIYIRHGVFDAHPTLNHQIKCLASMEANDMAQAKKHWSELAKISPDVYKAEFNYQGDKCLFSLCLKKHKTVAQPTIEIEKPNNKLDHLIAIFKKPATKISKEQLFKLIWGYEYSSESDMSKLRKLISRAKSERSLNLKSVKGCYFN